MGFGEQYGSGKSPSHGSSPKGGRGQQGLGQPEKLGFLHAGGLIESAFMQDLQPSVAGGQGGQMGIGAQQPYFGQCFGMRHNFPQAGGGQSGEGIMHLLFMHGSGRERQGQQTIFDRFVNKLYT